MTERRRQDVLVKNWHTVDVPQLNFFEQTTLRNRPRKLGANVVILTGGMAAGKTSVLQELVASHGVNVLGGYTTRAPRDGDVAGEFSHLSDEAFDEIPHHDILQGKPPTHGTSSRYAMRISDFVDAICTGEPYARPLAPITAIQSAATFADDPMNRQRGGLPVRGLLLPTPDETEQIQRAKDRGDSDETIEKRLKDEQKWNTEFIQAGIDAGLLVRAEEGSSVTELAEQATKLFTA